jgi:CheY-like chemotaxis protein
MSPAIALVRLLAAHGNQWSHFMKLLIAEDDNFFRSLLQQILAPKYELVFAHNGDEAWAAMQRLDAPRLAILDWVMPGLSGPQLCRKVRSSERLSSMYLILFTGRNSKADIASGLRAGADDYITKPFDAGELRARIRMGERALDWQDAVEIQSTLVYHALHREHQVLENPAGWRLSPGQGSDEDSRGVQNCAVGLFDPACPPDIHSELTASHQPLPRCLEKIHV